METNLVKKGIHSIYGGLQMLSESKTENLSALAEISIILSNSKIRERHQLDDNIIDFLSSIHFLLKDLNQESVKVVTDFINSNVLGNEKSTINIDYKEKYQDTLEKLNAANEELLKIKGVVLN